MSDSSDPIDQPVPEGLVDMEPSKGPAILTEELVVRFGRVTLFVLSLHPLTSDGCHRRGKPSRSERIRNDIYSGPRPEEP